MKRVLKSLCGGSTALLIALTCGLLNGQPAAAEGKGFFSARRSLGMVFLGGSAVLVKQGFDFKSEADDFYKRYENATDPVEIDRLYQRTNNRDIKSQISWALAGAFAISGVRLLWTDGADTPDTRMKATKSASLLRKPLDDLSLESQVDPGRIGLSLKKRFF